ncbi:MAG: hypothetical protein IKW30_11700 [Lachnospiraceae bacterium]|nr:hypothetical protein [Lachnospiraceae bacterium]
MNFLTFIENTAAVLEFVFFILTMYALIVGLKTKNYDKLKIYGAMYLVLNLIRNLYTYIVKKSVAVSIIGGADGPTSIFLAGKVGGSMIIYLISLVIILIGVAILVYLRKKK